MSVVDIDAERERIRKEIEELEQSLDPEDASIEVIVSGSDLETDSEYADITDEDEDDSDSSLLTEEDKADEKSDDGIEDKIPACPETCLQINLVYQEVIQEKIEEVALLLAQNKERQEELLWRLSGPRSPKPNKTDAVKARLFIGSYMKPYFKDKATGCGPPANQDTREKSSQGIKSFEELRLSKWRSTETQLLKDAVMSDSLQHLLQPKLFKHEYLNQKLKKATDEVSHQILEKQIRETEREIEDINQLSEARLLGERTDKHDWDKIANIHFEGNRSSEKLRKYWQNSEHPSINKEDWSEEEIKTLLEVAATHNYLNWQQIADELGTKRTAFQCLQKYQNYNKDFRRSEWTKEEDQMLTHLVEQMRVGNHIPYQKIAYYMEGRNTFQLIYRWTKSVDPNLKKGPWSKEEDAKLLSAISRYGERDWYKIREEVPHRSDSQCRDRYHNALNEKFKKGRWTKAEKAKLMQLVDKYGPGHWAKIASELPNRTDSQCLSRWKRSMGLNYYQKKGGKKREICYDVSKDSWEEDEDEDEEECSLESSEESLDEMELRLDDSSDGETVPHKITKLPKYCVPSIDLWVPTQVHLGELRNKLFAESLSKMRRPCKTKKKDVAPATRNDGSTCDPSGKEDNQQLVHAPSNLSTIIRGFVSSHLTHITTEDPTELLKEATDAGKYILKVEAENVTRILRRNSYFLRKKHAELKRGRRLSKVPDMSQILPDMSLDEVRDVLQAAKRQTRRSIPKARFIGISDVDRKLHLAVTPWVGDVIVIYSLKPVSLLKSGTKADAIKQRLQMVHLPSTPVFTLLLQLFKIDADGCLQVIRAATMPKPNPSGASTLKCPSVFQQPASLQNSVGPLVESIPSRSFPLSQGSLSVTNNATSGIQTPNRDMAATAKSTPGPLSFRRSCVPKEKPKTVSELLREKRMKACHSSSNETGHKEAATGEPKGLTAKPLSGQRPKQRSAKPQAPLSSPSSLTHSQPAHPAASLSVIPLNTSTVTPLSAAASPQSQGTSADAHKQDDASCGSIVVTHMDSSSEPAASSQTQIGKSLTSSSLQNQDDVPRQVSNTSSVENDISQTVAKATPDKSETMPPMTTVGNTAPIYLQPPLLNLLPTILPTQGGPQNVLSSITPYTFVLTPQGLLPVQLQTLLGFPGANQQATLSMSGLNAPSSNPVPLVGSSNTNISSSSVLPVVANANPDVISSNAAASSPIGETSRESLGEGQVAVKSSSAVLSSTSMNTNTFVSTSTPVLTPSSSSPNMSTTLSSNKIASPGESRGSNPGPVPSAADISTVVPSAELLCSLSLISLSKGGATEPEEPSSLQRETAIPLEQTPVKHIVPDIVRASTRLLTLATNQKSGTTNPTCTKSLIAPSKQLVCIAPRLPGTPSLTNTDRNKTRKPVSIAERSPTMPTLSSANKTPNLQQASIAVSTVAMSPVLSTATNQTVSPASIVMSAISLPHLPRTGKNQYPPSASVVRTLGVPPSSSAGTNQNPPPASVSMNTMAMPPPSSSGAVQNKLPLSVSESVLAATPVTSASTIQNLPPVSIALSTPSMPPPSSSGTNQKMPAVSIGLRLASMSHPTNIGNNQNQSPISVAVKNITMPPLSSTANKQHRPPVFIPVKNSKTPCSNSKNQKPSPVTSPEKRKVDFSLISLEEEAKVKQWFRGERGVQVPPLKNGMPYLPPSVCNLQTLSKLLQKKKELEKNVASLLPSKGENQEKMTDEQLQAVQDMVGQRLRDNPAYVLLKARFLSAFTLPAFLATLAPPKVRTTVRPRQSMHGDSDEEEHTVRQFEEMDTTEEELMEADHREDNPENHLTEMQLNSTTKSLEVSQAAAPFSQEHPVEETLSQETLNSSTIVIVEDTPVPVRRSARIRKRL